MKPKKIINPNLRLLCKSYLSGKRGVSLGGSSRSGKTWSGIDFLVWLCSKHITGKNIFIVRETYESFKTTLYNDFNKRLPQLGIKSPFEGVTERKTFWLFSNKVTLIGADKPGKYLGASSDYIFFNEIIEQPKMIFDQLEMRCEVFWWCDYNPSASKHWVYDSINKRSDVAFLKTTFLDNPQCPPEQKKKILSYEPTHPEDRELPKAERRPHPTNIQEGTADDYMWDVYGLGIKAELKGKIYQYTEYKDLPEGARFLGYGGDFGWNHPTVVVKLWQWMNNIYVQQIVHASEVTYQDIYKKMIDAGYNKNEDCCFDSEDPRGIIELKRLGLRVWRAYKKQGWVMHTIRTVKSMKLHIHVNSHKIKEDIDVYSWKWDDKTDTALDMPEEKGKDSADAIGYGVIRFIAKVFASE